MGGGVAMRRTAVVAVAVLLLLPAGVLLLSPEVNAADPTFTLEDTQDDGGNYRGVWGDGTYVYAVCYGDGVRAYSFDGSTFTLEGTRHDGSFTSNYVDVWGDGTYIYTACKADGVRAYSFDGSTFTLEDTQDDGGNYLAVWGDGTYVYTACDNGGVRAYSFDGSTFTLEDTQDDGDYYVGVWGDGTYIYTACKAGGVRAYSFDGSTFTLEDTQDDGGSYEGVWGDGTYVYTACYDDGIRAYSGFEPAANNPPNAPSNPVPADGSTISETTSTTLSVDVSDPDGDSMNVTFYDASDDSEIGTDTDVANDSTASVTWSSLSAGSTYQWYAVANDSTDTNTSNTWSFTVNAPPDAEIDAPSQDTVWVSPVSHTDFTDDDLWKNESRIYDDDTSTYAEGWCFHYANNWGVNLTLSETIIVNKIRFNVSHPYGDSWAGVEVGTVSGTTQVFYGSEYEDAVWKEVSFSAMDVSLARVWFYNAGLDVRGEDEPYPYKYYEFDFQKIVPLYTGEILSFSGSNSTDDGSISSYEWDFGDGGTGTGQNIVHSYDDNGTYTVTLTVTDNHGATNSTSTDIEISNREPSADFTVEPSSNPTYTDIYFNSTSSDSDGSIVNWTWMMGDGTTLYGEEVTHQYTDDGTYTVTLTIEDDDGATNSTSQTGTFTVTNQAPSASFTNDTADPSTADTITFTSTSSDADGSITNWTWQMGDGTTLYGNEVSHSYADNGTYTVTLTVTDDDGGTDTVSDSISVSNVAPTADYTYTPISPSTADDVLYDGSPSSDSDGTIVNYTWTLGDGTTLYGEQVTHSYADDGDYLVSLTVEDDDGNTTTYDSTVAISNVPPTANFTVDEHYFEDTSYFNDTSTDSDGSVVSWYWEFGDGNTSTNENAVHIYGEEGSYRVNLTVTDDDGNSSTASTWVYINREPPDYSGLVENPVTSITLCYANLFGIPLFLSIIIMFLMLFVYIRTQHPASAAAVGMYAAITIAAFFLPMLVIFFAVLIAAGITYALYNLISGRG